MIIARNGSHEKRYFIISNRATPVTYTKVLELPGNSILGTVIIDGQGDHVFAGVSELGSADPKLLFYKISSQGHVLVERLHPFASLSELKKIVSTRDGSYYAVSTNGTPPNQSLHKLGNDGVVLWTKNIRTGWGNSLSLTQTEGVVAVGYTYDSAGISRFSITRTDGNAHKNWDYTYNFLEHQIGEDVSSLANGDILAVGTTYSGALDTVDIALIKTDVNGLLKFQKRIDLGFREYGKSLQVLNDGGFIIAGVTDTSGNQDFAGLLIRANAEGDTVWTKRLSGVGNRTFLASCRTRDGGYAMTGYGFFGPSQGNDVLLVRTDSAGNLIWEKNYGGGSFDRGNSIQQSADGGFIIAGETESYNPGQTNGFIIKTDASGNVTQ